MTKLCLRATVRFQDEMLKKGYKPSDGKYDVVKKYWALRLLVDYDKGRQLSNYEIATILDDFMDDSYAQKEFSKIVNQIDVLYSWAYQLIGEE